MYIHNTLRTRYNLHQLHLPSLQPRSFPDLPFQSLPPLLPLSLPKLFPFFLLSWSTHHKSSIFSSRFSRQFSRSRRPGILLHCYGEEHRPPCRPPGPTHAQQQTKKDGHELPTSTTQQRNLPRSPISHLARSSPKKGIIFLGRLAAPATRSSNGGHQCSRGLWRPKGFHSLYLAVARIDGPS